GYLAVRVDVAADRGAVLDVERGLAEERVLERWDRLVCRLDLSGERRAGLRREISDRGHDDLAASLRPAHLILAATARADRGPRHVAWVRGRAALPQPRDGVVQARFSDRQRLAPLARQDRLLARRG